MDKVLSWTGLNGNNVSKSDSEVVPDNSVHPDLLIRDSFIGEDNTHTLLPLLTLNKKKVRTM